MDQQTRVIPVRLENDTVVQMQVAVLGGEEEIGFHIPSFKEVTGAIEEIAAAITAPIRKIKPHKATVEFGLDIAVESGQLTTLLVKGTGTASLKITLEWRQEESGTPGDAANGNTDE